MKSQPNYPEVFFLALLEVTVVVDFVVVVYIVIVGVVVNVVVVVNVIVVTLFVVTDPIKLRSINVNMRLLKAITKG